MNSNEEIEKPMPGSKIRTLISETQGLARTQIPHKLGGGGRGKVDDVCEFAMLSHEILLTKLREIASRRKPGGWPMFVVVHKAFSVSREIAKKLCITLGYDPETTVRDRE